MKNQITPMMIGNAIAGMSEVLGGDKVVASLMGCSRSNITKAKADGHGELLTFYRILCDMAHIRNEEIHPKLTRKQVNDRIYEVLRILCATANYVPVQPLRNGQPVVSILDASRRSLHKFSELLKELENSIDPHGDGGEEVIASERKKIKEQAIRMAGLMMAIANWCEEE